MSQLELACAAGISARHISFMETGRSRPSREMLLHLAERLQIPLRDRNSLLVSAGYAPVYPERKLDDPELEEARQAINLVLTGHEPYPALAIDRHWTLVSANRAVAPLLAGVDAQLLQPPINVMRLCFHPGGLANRILNYDQWREHLFARLRQQIDMSGDSTLSDLLEELRAYPRPDSVANESTAYEKSYANVVVPLRLRMEGDVLSLFSTTTVFGTPIDVTLSELAIESFFPADRQTAERLRLIVERG